MSPGFARQPAFGLEPGVPWPPGPGFLLAVALSLAASGCSAGRPAGSPAPGEQSIAEPGAIPAVKANPAVASRGTDSRTNGAKLQTGSIRVAVRWPEGGQGNPAGPGADRRAAAIPLATNRIDVEAYSSSGSGDQPITTTLLRAPFAGFASATLEHIPAGQVRLAAIARDAAGTVLASGGQLLELRPNEIVPATLRLRAPDPTPTVTRISQPDGFPGALVTLLGSGFGYTTGSPFSVRVGSVPVPPDRAFRYADDLVSFHVPLGATTSEVVLAVGSQEAVAPGLFTTIGSVSVSPKLAVVSRYATRSLDIAVYDTAGNRMEEPHLAFSYPLQSCSGCFDGDVGRLDARGVFLPEHDLYSGLIVIRIGIPPVSDETTIQVVSE